MKSHQTSVGKFCPREFGLVAGIVVLAVGLGGCGLVTRQQAKEQSAVAPGAAMGSSAVSGAPSYDAADASAMDDADVSLKADRAEIEKLRKSIPEDRRRRNDDLQGILKFFGEVRLPPETIQERYERMFEHERDQFNEEKEKAREEFDKQEEKERKEFERKLKSERKKYLKDHHTSDEREQFFSDQEDKRQSFNDDEREKRDEFDTAWRQKTDDFNSDTNDKRQEFMEQFRDYTQRYNAWQKSLHPNGDNE